MNNNQIEIAGHIVEFSLKKSLRTTTLRMRLDNNKRLHITAPRLMSDARIIAFLKNKEAWLAKHLNRIEDLNLETKKHIKTIKNGESYILFGQLYILQINFIDKKRSKAYFIKHPSNKLILNLHKDTKFKEISNIGKKTIEKLYKETAREYFLQRLKELNDEFYGFKYYDVRIKNQATRYGSCSSKGNLNFNWKVIMASLEVIDYLLIHELCHLKQMNHSQKFWDLVEKACPSFKANRTWLKKHGHTLSL